MPDYIPEIAHSDSGVHSLDSISATSSSERSFPSYADQQLAEERAEEARQEAERAADYSAQQAKEFTPPTDREIFRFRYTTYFGEPHPATNKVVLEFSTIDLMNVASLSDSTWRSILSNFAFSLGKPPTSRQKPRDLQRLHPSPRSNISAPTPSNHRERNRRLHSGPG